MHLDLRTLLIAPLLSVVAFSPGCATARATAGDELQDLAGLHNRTRQQVGSTSESLRRVVGHEVSRSRFEAFGHDLDELRALSTKSDAGLVAVRKRGESYFRRWVREIAQMRDADDRRKAEQHERERLAEFDTVCTESEDANMVVHDYVHRLEEMRTSLGQDLTASGIERSRAGATDLASKAPEVEKKLDEAAAAIRKMQPYFGGSGDTR